ncbi:DUF6538 domain-containing protein [Brucella pseudogrignonensis]|uniref:DUF6538 domain-containing protein n=1 Tax=Brucella pseudogrignonensis TaxID=419475 RepID=UPI000CFDE6DB|nr:DUF6538 domain-containing protein [Brucella pseudogrignonensis]MQP39619.1 integrase [Ochrobactrum sp. MYb237]PQZ44545.1 integrase [Brucella pseudogrignonensis]PRA42241.1 integrase [Brucella pseudogrignonensis]PRA71053.1 integrase [Brucella pseudogrignonensis]
MGLPMPSPYKHPKTGVYYLRQRVPADLKDEARGRIVALPISETPKSFTVGDGVKASLETKDPAEAKARYREADAALSKFWEALRNGPLSLTQKEVAERAGLVYKFFADTFEDDAEVPELWERSQRINEAVLKKAKLGKRPTYPLSVTQRDALAPRFGGFVDKLLIDTGEQVDEESRDKLLVAVAEALQQSTSTILKRVDGDYSPDTAIRQRYPEYVPIEKPQAAPRKTEERSGAKLDLYNLLDHKFKDKGKAKTHRDYRSEIDKFVKFIGHSDAERVTKANVREWRDALIAQGLSLKTINDKRLTAIKAVLAHGVAEFSLTQNVADGIRDKRQQAAPNGSKGYSPEQAKTILQATFGGTSKELDPHYQRAVFWVPWICAYTGLRVSEVTQLQGKNVRNEDGFSIFVITPEDGSTKSGKAWTTGIHPHLIEMGILDMFKAVGDGPAFYRAYPSGTDLQKISGKHRAKESASRVGDWVTATLGETAPGGRPNHAWRHTFTTVTRPADLNKEARDYMLGSRSTTDAREAYGDWPPSVVCREIEKVPRFNVKETEYRPTLRVMKPKPRNEGYAQPKKAKSGKLILSPRQHV